MIPLLVLLQATLAISVAGPSTSPEYLALRVAESHGYFADEGVQVSLRAERAETGAAEALARGRVDLAATSIDAALRLGHVQGAPPRLVAGLTRAAPVALLIPAALADSIRKVEDLAGRAVGIPAPGTPEHTHLVSLLARAGVPVHRVSIQSFGEAGVMAAFESGAAAAIVIGDPWAARLIADGKARALVDLRQPGAAATVFGGETVHAAIFARSDTRLGTPELLPFARALLRAMDRLAGAPPDELAARLRGATGESAEDWRARLAAARAVAIRDGLVTRDALERSIDLVRVRSPLPAVVKLPRRLDSLLLTDPIAQAASQRRR